MTPRISSTQLRPLIDALNVKTGHPKQVWTSTPGGSHSIVGCYVLDGAYGGWKVAQIANEHGGQHEVGHGYCTTRECYYMLRGMLDVL